MVWHSSKFFIMIGFFFTKLKFPAFQTAHGLDVLGAVSNLLLFIYKMDHITKNVDFLIEFPLGCILNFTWP